MEKPTIKDYIVNLFAPEDDILREIQAETDQYDLPDISVQAHEGRLLQWLTLLVGARKIVEIGALAGYSSVWLARALPDNGLLWTIEKSAKHARVARESFERAGLGDRVRVLQGNARDVLKKLGSQEGPFDFVFIDADKAGYVDYLAWAVEHLRDGGLVAGHNALRGGRIVAPETENDHAIHAFNRAMVDTPRLESMLIPIGDGLTVGMKRNRDAP